MYPTTSVRRINLLPSKFGVLDKLSSKRKWRKKIRKRMMTMMMVSKGISGFSTAILPDLKSTCKNLNPQKSANRISQEIFLLVWFGKFQKRTSAL